MCIPSGKPTDWTDPNHRAEVNQWLDTKAQPQGTSALVGDTSGMEADAAYKAQIRKYVPGQGMQVSILGNSTQAMQSLSNPPSQTGVFATRDVPQIGVDKLRLGDGTYPQIGK